MPLLATPDDLTPVLSPDNPATPKRARWRAAADRIAPWLLVALVACFVVVMSIDRERGQQRERDLERRLNNLVIGYREQRALRRENWIARMELERLKAALPPKEIRSTDK